MSPRQEMIRYLAGQVDGLKRDHPTRVAIDGVDAAGKTTLADEVADRLRQLGRTTIRASIDGFHNPARLRRKRGADSPEGYYYDSFNYAALRSALLDPLAPGGSRRFRRAVFDFRKDAPIELDFEEAPRDAVLVFDGVFLLRDELRECWDYSVFVEANFQTTEERALSRDIELLGSADEVRRRYSSRYVPGQRIYLSTVKPEKVASIVVENDEPSNPGIRDRR